MPWTTADIPDLHGRVAVVTGANGGLGLETARALAGAGAHVVMAARDQAKAAAAEKSVRESHAEASLEVVPLDLGSLASVRQAAERIGAAHPRIDILVNNAGLMAIPERRTEDGFEMQLGTNHLGHFALTGLLLPHLVQSALPDRPTRVVTVSSTAHKMGRMHFDDLQLTRGYGDWKAYGQSKLANLLFAFELDRRLTAAGRPALSVAAHPGYSDTDLQAVGPRTRGSKVMGAVFRVLNTLAAQPAAMGALPSLRAATDPDARGGQYYGPRGLAERAGPPVVVQANDAANDAADARRLWQISEELTGVSFGL